MLAIAVLAGALAFALVPGAGSGQSIGPSGGDGVVWRWRRPWAGDGGRVYFFMKNQSAIAIDARLVVTSMAAICGGGTLTGRSSVVLLAIRSVSRCRNASPVNGEDAWVYGRERSVGCATEA
jgi:hypothetical protein